MNYIGKTVLITGGTGYIGSALVKKFKSIDCNLIISTEDVSKRTTWDNLITKDIDFIFHLAAAEITANGDIEKDLTVNSVSVFHMLKTCTEKKCNPRIIFASSTNIFGNVHEFLVDENTESNPLAEWSAHKLLAEHYLRMHSSSFGSTSVVLRLPNVYGPVPKKETMNRMVINKVIQHGLENKQLKLYKNLNCYRDYIFVDDVINAFMTIGLTDENIFDGRFFVVGSRKLITIAGVWAIIAKEIGDVSITVDNKSRLNPIEMRSFVGDHMKLKRLIGWEPKIDLRTGIKRTIQELR